MLETEIKEDNQKEILNMHDAFIQELKIQFSTALGKDRLYNRPAGFLNDQQLYLIGVNIEYFLNSAIRYDHKDFCKAIKEDLGPILGNVGMWVAKNLREQAKEQKDEDLKKKLQIIHDIIEKYVENGMDVLGQEKKYNFMNKFGAKKCPDK